MGNILLTPLLLIFHLCPDLARAQWTEPIPISEQDSRFESADMITDSQGVYVIYYNVSYDPLFPRFVKSTDCGWSWSEPFNLADTADRSGGQPNIALAGDTLHAVWRGFRGNENPRVNYRRSTDRGDTWQETQLITNAYTYMKYPSIIEYDGHLFCAYNALLHNNPYDTVFIMGISSSDGGNSWGSHFRINPEVLSTYPMTLLESQGRFHLIYQTAGPEAIEIAHIYSDDLGETWSEPTLISPVDDYAGQWPRASVDSTGLLAACWFDYKYGSTGGSYGDILMNYSTDNGDTWYGEVRVTYEHSNQTSAILTDNPNFYVAYEDIRDGNREIYFRSSPDRGQNWSAEERITTDVDLDSHYPELSLSSCDDAKILHLAWSQEEGGRSFALILYSHTEIQTDIQENGISCMPGSLEINSIYPNPFNETTAIEYFLKNETNIVIEVFNILGERVAQVYDGSQKSGIHRIIFNAEFYQLSNGVYFVRIRNKDGEKSEKIMLLR